MFRSARFGLFGVSLSGDLGDNIVLKSLHRWYNYPGLKAGVIVANVEVGFSPRTHYDFWFAHHEDAKVHKEFNRHVKEAIYI
jgi:hypothetical protein